ncbi:MAG: Fe-S cluster assembly protein SufD [Chloroflexota bacterium]
MDTVITLEQEEMKLALPAPGFSHQAMVALSTSRGEPQWLLEKRYQGWHHYDELDVPFWRRTDIGKLEWETLIPFAPPQKPTTDLAALPPKLHAALATYGQRAGLLLQRDSAAVYAELAEPLRAQGVIFTDLNTAAQAHPELVQRYFLDEAVPVASDRYTALHAAFWSGGAFLYVPKNVEVALPLISVLWMELPQLAVFPPTLVVAEAGSRVTLVSELLSVGCEACPDTYHGGVTELHVGPGADVRYINVQDLGKHVYDLRSQTALLDRDSRLDWLTVNLGARLSRSSQHTVLRQPGVEARVTGLYLPDGRQHIAFDTLQDHIAPHGASDLLYQGALLGRSRAVYEGTIRAWPGAQKTNAYQSNRNLLLSKQARADSLPQLEIEANDLRCTHGATVSQVDEDHVFYLMSRGIPHAEAVRLIVEGFFQPTLDRLPESLTGLKDRLTGAIAAKLRG